LLLGDLSVNALSPGVDVALQVENLYHTALLLVHAHLFGEGNEQSGKGKGRRAKREELWGQVLSQLARLFAFGAPIAVSLLAYRHNL
jgi:hypothetical protein